MRFRRKIRRLLTCTMTVPRETAEKEQKSVEEHGGAVGGVGVVAGGGGGGGRRGIQQVHEQVRRP